MSVVLPPARVIGVVGDVYRFLATAQDTDGKYAMWEAIVPPGGGPPPHRHSREVEAFYVLEGEITFRRESDTYVAGAGSFVNMSLGVQHSFRNESDKVARMLVTVAPAGLEEMFFEVGQSVEADATSAPLPTPEDIARLIAAAPRYGVEIQLPSH